MAALEEVAKALKAQAPDKVAYFKKRLLETPEADRQAAIDKMGTILGLTQAAQIEEPSLLQKVGTTLKENLPMIGAAVGGAVGGTAAGAATMGLGAIGGGVAGAALGGAVGQSAKNIINMFTAPEEAPQTSGQAALSTLGGAAEGAVFQAGGEVVGPALKMAAKPLEGVASWLTTAVVGGGKTLMSKVGGPKQYKAVIQLLKDEGVTTTPGTLRMVGDRLGLLRETLGEELKGAYKAIDKSATQKYNRAQVIANVQAQFKESVLASGKLVDPKDLQWINKTIQRYLPKNADITHEGLQQLAKTIRGDKFIAESPKLAQRASKAIYAANEQFAIQATGDANLVATMRGLSSSFRSVASVESAVQKQLNPSLGNAVKQISKAAVGTAVGAAKGGLIGGPVGAAAVMAGTSTAGKTLAAAAAELGAKILSRGANLGPYSKILARVAADQGYKAVVARHAYLMVNEPKYRDLYTAAEPQEPELFGGKQ